MSEIDPADALARAYSRLVSLHDALGAHTDVMLPESYLTEFHGLSIVCTRPASR